MLGVKGGDGINEYAKNQLGALPGRPGRPGSCTSRTGSRRAGTSSSTRSRHRLGIGSHGKTRRRTAEMGSTITGDRLAPDLVARNGHRVPCGCEHAGHGQVRRLKSEGRQMTRRDWSRGKRSQLTEDFRHHPSFMAPLLPSRQRPRPPRGPSKAELRTLAERAIEEFEAAGASLRARLGHHRHPYPTDPTGQ
jgi:hypothetical protein